MNTSAEAVTKLIYLQNNVLDIMREVNQYLNSDTPNYSIETLNVPGKQFDYLDEMLTKKLIENNAIVLDETSHLKIIQNKISICLNWCINLITIKHYVQ
ncbi:Mv-ORF56 peptide [Maruca vitrata nucleopolyhedrovirus]|uniref:Mv-ORF56 peptide n=1 Tax=Maruca vitrata nucleopolyhedrovirus TaxID=1307954 RepID=A1YRB8_9ABAC|nr:Mv-ORF56 peptide [Maruca vitrata nucleopolyhedrovirus]ABL76008.1 Mv-ORF56 peptide [Maruca vitrata nucleopolyhedrovirus]